MKPGNVTTAQIVPGEMPTTENLRIEWVGLKAYVHVEGAERWMRLTNGVDEWEEPVSGWTLVLCLLGSEVDRVSYWRHRDGRKAEEWI